MMSQVVRNAYLDDSKQQMTATADDVKTWSTSTPTGALSYYQLNDQIAKAKANNAIWIINSDLLQGG